VIQRPLDIGRFEFVVLAAQRAAQLLRGCPPRIDVDHKATITAQLEVSTGKISRLDAGDGPGVTAV
jgi:DNA-directed RNA polymerase subunit K/omega